MEFIEIILQSSPPVLLAISINLVIFFLKKSPVADWTLPFIAMALGAILYPLIAEVRELPHNVKSPVIHSAVIGLAIGGFSVAINQGWRQWRTGKSTRKKLEGLK